MKDGILRAIANDILPVCTMPPEYCEFSSSAKKCREWLEKAHPELVEVIYNTSTFSYLPSFPESRPT